MAPPRRASRAADPDATAADPDATAADALARYYDLDLETDPGDLDLYLALARRDDGPILELAVGSGRLAVPLALVGHAVTGIDNDPAMLRRAAAAWQARAHAAAGASSGGSLSLVDADLLTADLGPRFGLAILGLNSLFLFADPAGQQAAVVALGRHLRPGGRAVVDVWLPRADELASYDGRVVIEWERTDVETGERVAKLASARYDAAESLVELTTWFDAWPAAGGPLRRTARRDALRLVSANELARMVETAGLTIETLAGDLALGPFGPGAERAVVVARRPRARKRSRTAATTPTPGRAGRSRPAARLV
ncbi:MAG TPA: class I SAM-dependent methyltransferase [Candidatus Limnocylindrales bacterium]|nr:class I SAM-dependent methyltransferase [Candidatus Limnocylindrales bacterium]